MTQHKKDREDKNQEQQEQEQKPRSSGDKKHKKKEDKKIKKLQQEKEEAEKQYQRALADYQNLLKRQAEEKEEITKYANEKLLRELLPVFDHLKISLQHVSEEEDNQWVKGVQYVIKEFREVLENNGVKEIQVEGEKFDPEYMEAVEGEGEVVSQEIKPGYTLNGKTIIPAKVKVEKEAEQSQEGEDNSEESDDGQE